MLTKITASTVTAYNAQNVDLELPWSYAELSTAQVQVRNVQGLEPVKANVNTSALGSIDGESYSGSSVGKRNIILTLGLNPDWVDQTFSSLRQLLYAHFMPKQQIRLMFETDELPDCEIFGYVEGFEQDKFAKDPEVQISIICPKPDFVAVAETVLTGPIVNSVIVNNPGTVPSGFNLTLKRLSGAGFTGYVFVDNSAQNAYSLAINPGTIDATYFLEINTVPGEKYILKKPVAGGGGVSWLHAMDGNWPKLDPGVNSFEFSPDGTDFEYTFTYFQRFGGL